MGSSTKTQHQSYVVTPSGKPDEPIVLPVTELPFLATDETGMDEYAAAGIGPTDAAEWHGAGFGPGGAQAYIEAGVDEGPATAKEFYDQGFGPQEAGEWGAEGFYASGAKQWADAGFLPVEAAGHTLAGLSPLEAVVESAEELGSGGVVESPEQISDTGPFVNDTGAVVEDIAPATTLADAGKVSEQAWGEAVTPVPDEITVGDPRGVPLLVGGADIEGSSATIMAYKDPAGGVAHEALFCTVTEDAEQKLLEALAPTGQKLVPKEVTHDVTDRLEVDKELKIFDEMKTAAVSVNHHMKAGDGIPEHTLDRINTLVDQVVGLAGDPDPEVQKMLSHYAPLVEALEARTKPEFAVPYAAGGKISTVTPYKATFSKTEIEMVPDTSDLVGSDKLAASSRKASRVNPNVVDGVVTWDGKSRAPGQGVEYAIELAEGFKAIYHPYHYDGQKPSSDHYSLRGQLEIHCPGGEGHAKELVDVLGSLNIVNRPMNGAEAEWTYLQKNIEAQGLKKSSVVAKAVAASENLESSVAQELMFKHAAQAVGMEGAQLEALAQKLTLEAEASALPRRVRIVRNAVAKAAGYGTGKDLAGHDSYQPMPRRSGGWMVFDRFDVDANKESLQTSFKDRCFHTRITAGNVLDIFKNGGLLASTERRALMGVKASTMSPDADKVSGGAKSSFLRVGSKGKNWGSNTIVWDEPLRLVRRADWYGYNGDHFGAVNPNSSHSTSGMTKDPAKVAGFSGGSNEVMFLDGLDLVGADAPSKVYCHSASERDAVRKLLKAQGITELGGRTVDAVITASA